MKNKEKSAATIKRILDSAENLFAEKGFEGATTRLIARDAGISIQTMHYHCGNKANLYLTVLRRAAAPSLEMISRHVRELMESETVDEDHLEAAIDAVIEDLFDILHKNPNYGRLYVRQYLEQNKDLKQADFESFAGVWAAKGEEVVKARGMDDVDLPLVLLNLAWMYHGMFVNIPYMSSFMGMSTKDPAYLDRMKSHAKKVTKQMIGLDQAELQAEDSGRRRSKENFN